MTSHDVIQAAVAAHNRRAERTVRDMEPLARVLVGTVLAILAACALVHWATPCADAQMCQGLLALPRRAAAHCSNALAGSWLHRAWVWPRAAYLRLVIAWAQDEVEEMELMLRCQPLSRAEVLHLQRQIRSHGLWIAERQIKLIDLDLSSRPTLHQGGTP